MNEKDDIEKRYKILKEVIPVSKSEIEKGLEIHEKAIVCDSLCPDPVPYPEKLIMEINKLHEAGIPISEINEKMQMRTEMLFSDPNVYEKYCDYWNRSGVTCISHTMGSNSLEVAATSIAMDNRKIYRFKDLLSRATCVDDILRAKKEGKHAILLNFQNIGFLEPKGIGLNALDVVYGLGIRVIQLTYNLRNYAGDGCTERYESGLSHFGVAIVEKMNKLHMLVDVGHTGYQSTLDAVEASKDPIVYSHTACKAIYDHPRGKTDEEIKALAEKDGYMGIVTLPFFLAPGYAGRLPRPGEKGTLNELLNHIDHVVNVANINTPGIGTDTSVRGNQPDWYLKYSDDRQFQRDFTPPRFWSGWSPGQANRQLDPVPDDWANSWINWPNITIGLVSRGYSDNEIEKIIGGNWLRVLKRVIG